MDSYAAAELLLHRRVPSSWVELDERVRKPRGDILKTSLRISCEYRKMSLPDEPPAARHLFEARLAEHVSARDEMIGSISSQHLVLTFGTASIVGVLVAGFLTWEDPVNWAVFFAIPPISAWILAMWLAEVVRMLRAVAFCREQAAVINDSLGMSQIDHPPIRWEAWRDEGDGRAIRWSYVSVVATLSGAYLVSVPLGLASADLACGWTAAIVLAFGLGLAALLTAVFVVFLRWTRPASKVGMPSKRDQ